MSLDVIWEEKGCWLLIRMEEKNKLLPSEIEIFFCCCVLSFFSGAKIGRKFRLWLTERERDLRKTLWAAARLQPLQGTTWGHRFFSFHHHQHHVGKITWFRKVVEKGRVAFSRAESYLIYAYYYASLYTFFSSSPKIIFIIIVVLYHTNNSFWCFWLSVGRVVCILEDVCPRSHVCRRTFKYKTEIVSIYWLEMNASKNEWSKYVVCIQTMHARIQF